MNENDPIAAFRRLHASGCFVLPNPSDAGSAILLASLGFSALATSSAAVAFARGRPDDASSLGLEATLDNVREIVTATDLPVNADFQSGYGATPEAVAESVRRCVATGVAGLSIEDATGDVDHPLFDESEALERVQAARSAIDASGRNVVLTARSECFLVGVSDPLETALRRLVAFAEAGADCLFAPGISSREEISEVVAAAAPKPTNVLAVDPAWMTVETLGKLGVRRISVGSALARVGWKGFADAARAIATTGSFRSLEAAEPFATLNRLFSGPWPHRR
ncbi:MAG: isocitrate lyase/phosphoenolpyruvate mutase family protein [Phycisphaerales bacterium]|nr:isocitrate lyase/phosphoenolpyruvate mutase family protein [Phycisphaerales bacterium]